MTLILKVWQLFFELCVLTQVVIFDNILVWKINYQFLLEKCHLLSLFQCV